MSEVCVPSVAKPMSTEVACAHCGLPSNAAVGQTTVFCCSGCMGAYALIHELGLEDYYFMRADSIVSTSFGDRSYDGVLEDLQASGVEVRTAGEGLSCVRLSVDGLHCAACSWLIERMQPMIHGLHRAQVRMSDQTVELIYDPVQTSPGQVARRFNSIGYRLTPWYENELGKQSTIQQQREHWMGLASAAFFAANAMWIGIALYAGEASGMAESHAVFLRWTGIVLAILSAAFPGRIFFTTAWQAIRSWTPHIDIPIAVSLAMGIVGGLIGAIRGVGHIYFDSLASLVLLLRLGRYIQFRAQHKSNHWVQQWMRMYWLVANRVESDGSVTKVPAYRLVSGERVMIRPNETIPADVTVEVIYDESEMALVDTSLFTGEAKPTVIRNGQSALGGSINLSTGFLATVEAAGKLSRVGRLMENVREATSNRTPWTMAADRVSKWFVIGVLAAAMLTWFVWAFLADAAVATGHAMALLTVACPCALALAAPLVLTVAMGRAAKSHIWIRDGNCLEKLATPGVLWLDKTGTLTHGRMQVIEFEGDACWLMRIATLERTSVHPVANAIVDFVVQRYSQSGVVCRDLDHSEILNRVYCVGRGITGRIGQDDFVIGTEAWTRDQGIEIVERWQLQQTMWLERGLGIVWISVNGCVQGMFALGDPMREGVATTLAEATSLGWHIGIVSGDRQEIVDQVALELRKQGIAIGEARGDLMPEQKQDIIRGSKAAMQGTCVMLGDGINDSAALASADVGIAIRGGSDHSLRAAPIYLASNRIESLSELLKASRKTVQGIQRCFVVSLVYNSFTISLASLGWIHPLMAAILMPISGVSVLLMAITTRTFQTESVPKSRSM